MSSLFRALSLLLAVFALSACDFTADTKAATRAAETFHAQLNAGAFDDIYSASDPRLQAVASRADFLKLAGAVHRKLGAFQSVEQSGVFIKSGTNGTFVTLTTKSRFEKGPAEEQFVFVMSGDGARLVSYHINSMALITE